MIGDPAADRTAGTIGAALAAARQGVEVIARARRCRGKAGVDCLRGGGRAYGGMIPKREPGIQRQQQLPGAQRGLFHPGEAHAQRLLDRAAVVVAAGVSGEPQQGGDGQAGAAGNRRVQ